MQHRNSKQSRLAPPRETAGVGCAKVSRGAGALPFRGWPPGVTRLIGPPCRYKREIITLYASVQTRISPFCFCPPTAGQRHRAREESRGSLELRRARSTIEPSLCEIYGNARAGRKHARTGGAGRFRGIAVVTIWATTPATRVYVGIVRPYRYKY